MQSQKVEALTGFAADHQWVEDYKEALLNQYPDQWIAVRGGKVVANAPELTKLLETLPDPAHTCIEYITSESLEMVL